MGRIKSMLYVWSFLLAFPSVALDVVFWNTRAYFGNELDLMTLNSALKKFDLPDVLSLAEATPYMFDRETKARLSEHYPYSRFVPYTKEAYRYGFWIFSKEEFSDEMILPGELAWTAPGSDEKEIARKKKEKKDWLETSGAQERPYIRVSLPDGDAELHMIFTHLTMPWNHIKQEDFDELRAESTAPEAFRNPCLLLPVHEWFLEKRAKFSTFCRVTDQEGNPNVHQFRHLMEAIQNDTGIKEEDSILLMGDFNAFKRKLTRQSGVYTQIMEHGFRDLRDDNQHTFPTEAFKEIAPKVNIDHAFALVPGNRVTRASSEVIPERTLRGSDHRAIRVTWEKPSLKRARKRN